jgi:hypothetical protein
MNKASYSVTRSIGTTVKVSFGQETSTTTPTIAEFDNVTAVKNAMNQFASVIEHAPKVPYAPAIASALRTISSGLGEIKATETQGAFVTQDHLLKLEDTWENSTQTIARVG